MMQFYAEHDLYNRSTGKKDGTHFAVAGTICDYCGKIISTDFEVGIDQQVRFQIDEVGGAEQTYYYYDGRKYDIPDTANVDIHKIFEEHPNYDYCTSEDGESCSQSLFVNLLYITGKQMNLEQVMQDARLRVVAKLLNDGRSAKELKIEKD